MMELFEEIFSAVCEENDMDWYKVFDGALMDEVNDRIMKATGMTMDELEDNDEYCEWYGDMAGVQFFKLYGWRRTLTLM